MSSVIRIGLSSFEEEDDDEDDDDEEDDDEEEEDDDDEEEADNDDDEDDDDDEDPISLISSANFCCNSKSLRTSPRVTSTSLLRFANRF